MRLQKEHLTFAECRGADARLHQCCHLALSSEAGSSHKKVGLLLRSERKSAEGKLNKTTVKSSRKSSSAKLCDTSDLHLRVLCGWPRLMLGPKMLH